MTPDTAAVSASITLRLATDEDTDFLLRLFAGTREEFKMLIGDESQLAALVNMQFNFQRRQFRDGYPDGKDQLVLLNEKPIGRMLVDEGDPFTLIDIALLPEFRNQGIGRRLLDDLIAQARQTRKSVRLQVVRTNPARHLYERLGFREVSADSVYCKMICEPK